MTLTERSLNRATLARQMLLERESVAIVDATRRLVAIQAQSPPSPYLALWNRLAGFEFDDLDREFSGRTIVKASLLRITLHAAAAVDHPMLHAAMTPTLRAARLNDKRFVDSGVSVAEADRLISAVVAAAAEPMTVDQIQHLLSDTLRREVSGRVWWALRAVAPLVQSPTDATWSFDMNKRFVAGPAAAQRADVAAARRDLIRRYLTAFGPATPADISQFCLIKRGDVRPLIDELADELTMHQGPHGALLDVLDGRFVDDDTPAPPRLLGMWDNVLLAYADRRRIIPEAYRAQVIRRNGDVLPTILVDGRVVGVWRSDETGIETVTFEPLSDDAWNGIATEAAALIDVLTDRDSAPYRRYDHWWHKLPDQERWHFSSASG